MKERTKCPISNKNSYPIFERSFSHPEIKKLVPKAIQELVHDKAFKICYCDESDLYFQTWILEESELNLLYKTSQDQIFTEEISNQKLHSFSHQTEEILVFRQLCKEKIPKVLDFGCSWGKWGSMALAHGCDVYGFDVDVTAREFCSKRGIKMINWDEIKETRFDFINCDQVLEHVADPLELVLNLSKSLKTKGFLKISTPQDKRLLNFLRKASYQDGELNASNLDALYPLIHVNLFTRKSLVNLGRKANLIPHALPLLKWIGAGQLWNIPRQLNRNLRTPFKRWRGSDTYVWFVSNE